MNTSFDKAMAAIDAINSEDPRKDPHDQDQPFELAYSRRMTAWLEKLDPTASEELRLAVRAQHVARWRIPRESYPTDAVGYQVWRSDLAALHAEIAVGLLRESGYHEPSVGIVRELLLKKGLKTNPECQTLEDVACLVFLEFYFEGFGATHPEQKVVRILQQTWGKMSDQGHDAALQLQLNEDSSRLIQLALSE